jgi:hypothetical protein
MNQQEVIELVKARIKSGEASADQANVEMVRIERVRLITSRVPASVRKELNIAVKAGRLCHIAKDGYRPEAYYHPEFDYMAKEERGNYADAQIRALAAASGIVFAKRELPAV